MTPPTIIFFGSFQHYSAEVLEGLVHSPAVKISAVITTPPYQAHPNSLPVKSEVHQLAEKYQLPVLTPAETTDAELAHLDTWLKNNSLTVDLFVTAGYGKLLSDAWLTFPASGSLNLHFSLLPQYRGANPAEWAILRAETETGITLIEMGPEFDTGTMVAQYQVAIAPTDTRETLYQKMYAAGKKVLPEMVAGYMAAQQTQPLPPFTDGVGFFWPPKAQPDSPTPFAKRFTRNDGFIAWEGLQAAMAGQPISTQSLSDLLKTTLSGTDLPYDAGFVERAVRALAGFPSLWTKIPTSKGEKRMKILAAKVTSDKKLALEQVQVEGQSPATWNQVKNIIPAS